MLYPTTPVINWGLNGATAAQIYSIRWAVSGVGLYTDHVVLGGINDIRVGTSAAATYADLLVIYAAVLAQGSHLYPVTLFPAGNFAGWTGAKQTELESLNTMIRDYCTAANPSRVTCIEAYNSDLRTGTNLAAIYDSGDGLHQNQAGSDYFSTLVHAVLP